MGLQERILDLLKAKGLLQKDLAAYLGISPSTLNSWIKLGRDIPAQHVIPICEFLNCSPIYLLTGRREEEAQISVGGLSKEALQVAGLWERLDTPGKAIILGELYRRMEMKEAREADPLKKNGSGLKEVK